MSRPRHVRVALALAVALLVLAGCGAGTSSGEGAGTTSAGTGARTGAQRFPDVQEVDITRDGEDTYTLAVTISSPYDSPERYADGWRVLDPAGTELGAHTLAHDHAGEQPFTRTQSGLTIPADIARVTVEGRDLVNGFGGETVTVDVPRP